MLDEMHVNPSSVCAVGHRVVHGGSFFTQSVRITKDVLKKLHEVSKLAPLHNPPSLEGIEIAQKLFPKKIPEIAVFDTAFHSKLKPHVALYPIPLELSERYHIKRYGFHGISHAYLWKKYAEHAPHMKKKAKVVTLHLGSGCSLAAIHAGVSIDTTMGFTPLDGLMMATRSGSIDPAIVAYLSEQLHIEASQVIHLLNNQSGLLGVSEETEDMRLLLASKDPKARLAIQMFIYSVLKGVSSFVGALGGVDALIFSGGIGEHASFIRKELAQKLSWLGVKLDLKKNEQSVSLNPSQVEKISARSSYPEVYVIATDENEAIASEVSSLIRFVKNIKTL